MASNNDVKFKIEVDAKGAIRTLRTVDNEFEGLETASSAAGASLGVFGAALGGAVAALGTAAVAFGTLNAATRKTLDLLDKASQIGPVVNSFQVLSEAAGIDAAGSLDRLREATLGVISDTQLMTQVNQAAALGLPIDRFDELAGAAVKLGAALGKGPVESIESLVTGVGRASIQMLDNLGIIVKAEDAYRKFAEANNMAVASMTEAQRKTAFQTEALAQLQEKSDSVADVTGDAALSFQSLGSAIDNATDKLALYLAKNPDLQKALDSIVKSIEKIDLEAIADLLAKITTKVLELIPKLLQLAENLAKVASAAVDAFDTRGRGFKNATATLDIIEEFNNRIADLTERMIAAGQAGVGTFRDEFEALRLEISQSGLMSGELAEQLSKIEGEFSSIDQIVVKVTASAEKLTNEVKEGVSGAAIEAKDSFAEMLREQVGMVSEAIAMIEQMKAQAAGGGFLEILGDEITFGAGGLANAITKGNSEQIFSEVGNIAGQAIGQSAGQAIGTAIGGSLGGPVGAVVGNVIGDYAGEFIGDGLESIFGGKDDDRKKARKAIQAFLGETIGFSLDLSNYGVTWSDQEGDIERAFTGFGQILNQLAGEDLENVAGEIGGALVDNVGKSLNDLGILIRSTGLSLEDMKNQLLNLALTGEQSFLETQTAIQGVARAIEAGIPDAVGAVGEAFQNMIEAGVLGGVVTVDALSDIGAEAQELGANTIPELANALIESGKATESEVQKLVTSLEQYGIATTEQLKNISNEAAVAVLASLEAAEFPFAQTKEDLNSVLDLLREIPESKDVEINVRTNFDANTRQAVESGVFTPGFAQQ